MRTIIVLRCLGVLLLAAAGMKAHGLAIEPVSAIGWLSSSWFQFGLIQLEMLVGVWLLLAWHLRAAWLAAFVLFSLFGVVSLHQASVGITSCGCFGHVSVHPWHAFAIDLFALAMLWIGRPSRLSLSVTTGNFTGPVKEWLIIATVLVGIFAGGVYLSFGSLDAALVYFRGERLSVRPSVVDVGVGATGQERAFEVELVNWSDAAIEVIGGTSDCSCIAVEDLPISLAPGETRAISVVLRFASNPGFFMRSADLFIDDGQLLRVRFRLTGRAVLDDGAAAEEGTSD